MGVIRYKMKYKVGDKVKIRTWESMVEEYGTCSPHKINNRNDYLCCFNKSMDENVDKLISNRILIIEEIIEGKKGVSGKQREICKHYIMKEMVWNKEGEEETGDLEKYRWTDSMIDHEVTEKLSYTPITSRFDLLDL